MAYSTIDPSYAESITQRRPPPAVPLNIPLNLQPKPPGSPSVIDPLQEAFNREERERSRQYFEQQRQATQAREAEIFRREAEQRQQIQNAINSGYPPNESSRRNSPDSYVNDRGYERQYSSTNNSRTPSPATPPPTPRDGGNSAGYSASNASTDPPSTGSPRQTVEISERPGTRPSNSSAAVASGNPGGGYASTGGQIRSSAPGIGVGTGAGQFAIDLINGRNPVDAAGHSAATAAGAVVGAVVCSELGPVGAMVCSSVGGTLGGALYDKFFHPAPAEAVLDEPIQASPPFYGGQGEGIKYTVVIRISTRNFSGGFDLRTLTVWGAFGGLIVNSFDTPFGYPGHRVFYRCHGQVSLNFGAGEFEGYFPNMTTFYLADFSDQNNYKDYRFEIVSVTRLDGQPDTFGNPSPPPLPADNRTPESRSHPTNDTAPSRGTPAAGQNPLPNNYGIGGTQSREGGNARGDAPDFPPHAAPAGTLHPDAFPYPLIISPLPPSLASPGTPQSQGAPNNSTNGSPVLGQPITINADGSVTFATPGHINANNPAANAVDLSYPRAFPEANAPLEYPRAFPEATFNPPLSTTGFSASSNLNNLVPSAVPQPIQAQPTPTATNPIPPLQSAPGTGTQTATQPTTVGSTGATGTQTGLGTPSTGVQTGTGASTGTGTSGSGLPSTGTGTQTGTQPSSSPPATQSDLEQMRTQLQEAITNLGLPLVGITQLLNPIPQIANNTTPEALKNAAAAGTCSTLKPGGCMAPLANNAERAANASSRNESLLSQILNILRGANETLLPFIWENVQTINSKLGDAVPGGISGFLGRGFKMLRIPQLLSLFTFITTIHNAAMLSSQLKDTLLSMLGSFSGLLGIKDEHGNDYDFNSLFNQGTEDFFKLLLGTETVNEIKADWIKYNRIYQAAVNMLSAVQSMISGLQQGVELLGNYVALIGNGLKAAGGVSERAYKWMSEKMNLSQTSKFLQIEKFSKTVQGATDVFSNFDMIAQSAVQVKDSYKQFTDAKDEFNKGLKTEENNKELATETAKTVAQDPGYSVDALNSVRE